MIIFTRQFINFLYPIYLICLMFPQLRRGGAGGAVRRQHARVARARRVPRGPSRRVEQPVRPRTREYPLKSRARTREYSGRPSCFDPHSQSRAHCSTPKPMHTRTHAHSRHRAAVGSFSYGFTYDASVNTCVADAQGDAPTPEVGGAPPLRRALRLSQVPCPLGFTSSGVRARGTYA